MSSRQFKSMEFYIGCTLTKPVLNRSGGIILPANTIFEKHHIQKILNHNLTLTVDYFFVNPESSDAEATLQKINQAVSEVRTIFDQVRETSVIPLHELLENVLPIISEAIDHPNLFELFSFLQSKDDYTYRHNIGVAVIAALLGRWLKLTPEEQSELTLAALLHDIGKVKIPIHILTKPAKLTPEEYRLIQDHTRIGYELILNTPELTEVDALVALQHHEREDGSGYPDGIIGSSMHYFSKIVAVADVFHAMSTERVYHGATPFYLVLKQMQDNAFGKMDPHINLVFLQKLMNSLIGNQVLLTDGQVAQIVLIEPQDPVNPIVQIGQEFINLSQTSTLYLEKILA